MYFLGIQVDSKLLTRECIHEIAVGAGRRLRALLKAKRLFTKPSSMVHYKARVLSYIEYRTPTLYHCCSTTLDEVDSVQRLFLREVGLTPEEALVQARRDMAMLGVIHRFVIGRGPPQFGQFLRPATSSEPRSTRRQARLHSRQLEDPREVHQSEQSRCWGHRISRG